MIVRLAELRAKGCEDDYCQGCGRESLSALRTNHAQPKQLVGNTTGLSVHFYSKVGARVLNVGITSY